jgi:multidrug transporter EmrE-like cation transporter
VNALSFLLIIAGVLLNAGAQLLLKAGTNAFGDMGLDRTKIILSAFRIVTEPHIFGGLACYVISVAIWILALSRVSVSVAYPMLSIGYVVNAVAAWYLFGEALSVSKLAGIGFIIVGVIFVARS